MRKGSIAASLSVVPLRHTLIAVGLTLALAAVCIVFALRLPQEYTASATLLFDPSAAPAAATAPNREPAEQLAQSILTADVLKTLATHLGLLSAKPSEAARQRTAAALPSHLTLSQTASVRLRVSWKGADRGQSAAMANAVANLLASWEPVETASAPVPAVPVSATPLAAPAKAPAVAESPQQTEPRQTLSQLKAREATLRRIDQELGEQMDATDHRLIALGVGPPSSPSVAKEEAELRTERARLDQQMAGIEQTENQLHAQEVKLLHDLKSGEASPAPAQGAQPPQKAAAPASAPPTSAGSVPNAAQPPSSITQDAAWKTPFTLLEAAAEAQPSDPLRQLVPWLGCAAALLCGTLYFGLAMRRFRPVEGAASLERILPYGTVLLGAVPHLGRDAALEKSR